MLQSRHAACLPIGQKTDTASQAVNAWKTGKATAFAIPIVALMSWALDNFLLPPVPKYTHVSLFSWLSEAAIAKTRTSVSTVFTTSSASS